MASFNRVILAGNLTRDPEVRYTPQGRPVAKFGLAVNRRYTTESGERREEVSFIDVEAWGQQAENIGKYMRKGRPLLLEGRLKQDTWEDKNTHQKQSKLKVVLDTFTFIDSRGPDAGEGGASAMPGRAATPQGSAPVASSSASEPMPADGPPPEEDDVPF